MRYNPLVFFKHKVLFNEMAEKICLIFFYNINLKEIKNLECL